MSTTELSDEAIARFMAKSMREGKDLSMLKLWWHSHADMNVFWSKTDDECAAGFSSDWMLSIVVNRARDIKARLDVYKPFYLIAEDISVIHERVYDADLVAAINAEVAAKVTHTEPKKYIYHVPYDDFREPWDKDTDGMVNRARKNLLLPGWDSVGEGDWDSDG